MCISNIYAQDNEFDPAILFQISHSCVAYAYLTPTIILHI